MNIKKILALLLVGMLLISLAGCGANQPAPKEEPQAEGKYKDGIYFAQEDGFAEKSGWKYVVTIEVKDGKIAKVDWNGAHKSGGPAKKDFSKSGQYPMVEQGGAKAPWHEQAAVAEAYLIEKQDPKAITYKEDNYHTDDIAGVTIGVSPLFKLAEKALANAPVGSGKYKDGAYYSQDSGYSKGYKYSASLTVINGYIVAAEWNGYNVEGGKDKKTLSADGEYPMVEQGGAKAPWHEQAAIAEAFLLEKQDPTITYQEDKYHTDDIAGVSIGVSPFFKNVEAALANGPIAPQGPYVDGIYYSAQENFSEKTGWKYNVQVAVKNGKIVGVDWTGTHKDGGDDKDTLSAKGEYGLVEKGGAQAEWHEQAAKVEAFLLEKQDPTAVTYDDAGKTDDIAGATIGVGEFFELVETVLKKV